MHLRFLTGRFQYIDSFAINDFESLTAGVVTDLPGATENGDCHFEAATFHQR